jgi:hypothetical protein
MSLAFDENGRPFIILREQEKKKRIKGLEAHKVSSIPQWPPIAKLSWQPLVIRLRPQFHN